MKIFPLLFILAFFQINSFAQNSKKIHQKAIVIDTHGDIMFNQIKSGIDIGKLQSKGNFDLIRAKQGGLDVQFFSIWCDEKGGYALANRQIDSLYSLIKRYPNRIQLVKTASELEKTVKEKKLAAMIGVEGGHMIENRLDYIDSLAKRGMAYLTLTWNNSTAWSSSAAEETSGKIKSENAGLNNFGKQVVQQLNKLGVLVDLSHVGEKTFYDAIATSSKPVIVSHSCAYRLNPVPRNLKDEQIKAVGKNGGVICINFYSGFLDSTYDTKVKSFFAKHDSELKMLSEKYGRSNAIDTLIANHQADADATRPPISLLIKHINHVVGLIGVDHVGLGADFDGAESFPLGMNSVADYPKITSELIKNGYSETDIKKILGGNVIRLIRENKGE
ncbi:membrane dipeptidase [Pedobacter chinensis]|uniref:Membrane dipeptidase n=1 Tax=Pedobacter chinensis TaxID=2282421 RepID=A0A369PXA0_9SPHI|nr:dipeptidase [Pedobacter chinensis]RDC55607.1 membrane dipeptidase [Pedobacter chinensis]